MLMEIEDALRIDKKVFFILRGMRILLKYDIEVKKIEIISRLPDGKMFEILDGVKMHLWNNKIVFSPMGLDYIWFYDIFNGNWQKTRIDIPTSNGLNSQLFLSKINNNWMYLLGCHAGVVICFNLLTEKVKIIELDKKNIGFKAPYFGRFEHKVINNNVIVPLLNEPEKILIVKMLGDDTSCILETKEYKNIGEEESISLFGCERIHKKRNLEVYLNSTNGGILKYRDKIYTIPYRMISDIVCSYIVENHLDIPSLMYEENGIGIKEFINMILS